MMEAALWLGEWATVKIAEVVLGSASSQLKAGDTAVDGFKQVILGWVVGENSAKTFRPLGKIVATWQCYFYVTEAWSVYPGFIPAGDSFVSKTADPFLNAFKLESGGFAYMTRVEAENTRLRHYLAMLHRKTLCYSKSLEMLPHSIRLLLHYFNFWDVPVPH